MAKLDKKSMATYVAQAMYPEDIAPTVINSEVERLRKMKVIELEALLWNAKKVHKQRQEEFGTILI